MLASSRTVNLFSYALLAPRDIPPHAMSHGSSLRYLLHSLILLLLLLPPPPPLPSPLLPATFAFALRAYPLGHDLAAVRSTTKRRRCCVSLHLICSPYSRLLTDAHCCLSVCHCVSSRTTFYDLNSRQLGVSPYHNGTLTALIGLVCLLMASASACIILVILFHRCIFCIVLHCESALPGRFGTRRGCLGDSCMQTFMWSNPITICTYTILASVQITM